MARGHELRQRRRRFFGGASETTDEIKEDPSDASANVAVKQKTVSESSSDEDDPKRAPFFMYYIDQMQKQMHTTQTFIRSIALYTEQVHCLLKTSGQKHDVISSMYEDYWPDAKDFKTAMEDMTYLWSLHQEDMAKLQPCIEEYVDHLEEIQNLVDVHSEAEVTRMKEEDPTVFKQVSKSDVITECKWTQAGGKKPVGEFLLQWHCKIPKTARGLQQLLSNKGNTYVSNCHIPLPVNRPAEVTPSVPLLMDSGPCDSEAHHASTTSPQAPTTSQDHRQKTKSYLSFGPATVHDHEPPPVPIKHVPETKDSFSRCCSKLNIRTGKFSKNALKETEQREEDLATGTSKRRIEDTNPSNPNVEDNLFGGFDQPFQRQERERPKDWLLDAGKRRRGSRFLNSPDEDSTSEEEYYRHSSISHSTPNKTAFDNTGYAGFNHNPNRRRHEKANLYPNPKSGRHAAFQSPRSPGAGDSVSHKRFAGGARKKMAVLPGQAPDEDIAMPDITPTIKSELRKKLPVLMLSRIQFLRCCVGKHLKDLEKFYRELAEVTHRANQILYDLPCYNPCVLVGETICKHPTGEDPIIHQLWKYYPEVREECCRRKRVAKGRGPPRSHRVDDLVATFPSPQSAKPCPVNCPDSSLSTSETCPVPDITMKVKKESSCLKFERNDCCALAQNCLMSAVSTPSAARCCASEPIDAEAVKSVYKEKFNSEMKKQCDSNRSSCKRMPNSSQHDQRLTKEVWRSIPVRSSPLILDPPLPQVQCYYPYVNP